MLLYPLLKCEFPNRTHIHESDYAMVSKIESAVFRKKDQEEFVTLFFRIGIKAIKEKIIHPFHYGSAFELRFLVFYRVSAVP